VSYELTAERKALVGMVRNFVEMEVIPNAPRWDAEGRFPLEAVLTMGELGLFGITFPERYGGGGGDFTSFCLAVEEIARGDSSLAITLSAAVGLGANPIYRFGNEQQRLQYLPDMCAGRRLGAFGLTEPDTGSDAKAIKTRAERIPDGWRITGSKAYITNSGTPITSVITVAARCSEGITSYLVPAGSKGLVVEPGYRKLGWRASDTHGLNFQGVEVPDSNVLGSVGGGLSQFLAILDDGRISIAALAVGLTRACLDAALLWAKNRNAFGSQIGRYQGIAFKLADMKTKLEAARHLVYYAASLKDSGKPYKSEAAMAKLFATEAAVDAARDAVQIFGGAGFIEESPVARFFRDSKILEIGEGTSEIQRIVIARSLGLPV
jgi:short/branched chain acyl-CoA dehydrogenase